MHNHYGLYCNHNVDLYLHLYLCTLIIRMVSDGVDVVCTCLPRSSIVELIVCILCISCLPEGPKAMGC